MDDGTRDDFDWGDDVGEREDDVLRFEVAGVACAVAAEFVTEVAQLPEVTAIPSLPAHILGVAVRRRKVLGLLDLAAFLGLTRTRKQSASRLLVLDVDQLEVGVVVDATAGLEEWPDDADAHVEDLGHVVRKYALGAHWAPGGRVVLLDFRAILQDAAIV